MIRLSKSWHNISSQYYLIFNIIYTHTTHTHIHSTSTMEVKTVCLLSCSNGMTCVPVYSYVHKYMFVIEAFSVSLKNCFHCRNGESKDYCSAPLFSICYFVSFVWLLSFPFISFILSVRYIFFFDLPRIGAHVYQSEILCKQNLINQHNQFLRFNELNKSLFPKKIGEKISKEITGSHIYIA